MHIIHEPTILDNRHLELLSGYQCYQEPNGRLIQALGFSLLEEESRGKDGRLINCGTWDAWTILDG